MSNCELSILEKRASDRKLRVLTIGEGDLTLSLALIRCYGPNELDLTASTLLNSKEKLVDTYSNARDVLQELQQVHGVPVLYGVDATQLHCDLRFKNKDEFDAILFHHPHLGLESLRSDEEWHAKRHSMLLAHYLWSAAQCVSAATGLVHVCLCGTQSTTWRLFENTERLGLCHVVTQPTHEPPHAWLSSSLPSTCLSVQTHYPAPRRYRNGRLGSKHFLGKYGYRHRRTHGDVAESNATMKMNVEGSQHFVFRVEQEFRTEVRLPANGYLNEEEEDPKQFVCQICGAEFASREEMNRHLEAPALPDPISVETYKGASTSSIKREESNSSQGEEAFNADHDSPQHLPLTLDDFGDVPILACEKIVHSYEGKRLRWYLSQRSLGSFDPNRKRANQLIKQGCVLVNSKQAYDSSRILRAGDEVHILEKIAESANSAHVTTVEIVRALDNIVVAFKPTGMRTCGTFSEQTLEMIVSRQVGQSWLSLSKLDTGCAGLCVLHTGTEDKRPALLSGVSHFFTALVHGRFPRELDGRCFSLCLDGRRRWGKTSKKRHSSSHEEAELLKTKVLDRQVGAGQDSILIRAIEMTSANKDIPALSTLQIETSLTKTSGISSSICYVLRKNGFPVVGDRFSRSEFLELPRSMRNRIKNKVCIGCYEVTLSLNDDTTRENVHMERPSRLSAVHWQQHCEKDDHL